MFFFGLKEFQGTFAPMWNRIKTNKVVACQYPNDADGNAFRGGFEPLIKASGYKVVDGGPYTDGTTDFTSMISKFKSKHGRGVQQLPAAAGLQHVLEAGLAAGLQAEAGDRRQGAAVPGRHRGARPAGQQHRHRLLVGPVHAEQLLAGPARPPGARRRIPVRDRQPVGAVDRLLATPCSRWPRRPSPRSATRTTPPRSPTPCTTSTTRACAGRSTSPTARRPASGSSTRSACSGRSRPASTRSR